LGLGVGAAALLLGLGAWAVELGWIAGPGWVLLAWAGSIVTALVVAWLAWDALRGLTHARLAHRLEELGAWRPGTLTPLLDQPAPGTSASLLAQADAAQARELERRGPAEVEPIARPVRLLAAVGLAVLVLG